MTLNELTQFSDLRTVIKTIEAQVTATHLAISAIKEQIDDAYFRACLTLDFDEDGGANVEAVTKLKNKVPFSMRMATPDKGYAIDGMGDLTATSMV